MVFDCLINLIKKKNGYAGYTAVFCRQGTAALDREDTMNTMNIDKLIFRFAGGIILLSLVLSQLHHPAWLWLTAFVGANLLQSSFTGFCPVAKILKPLGVKPGRAFE